MLSGNANPLAEERITSERPREVDSLGLLLVFGTPSCSGFGAPQTAEG